MLFQPSLLCFIIALIVSFPSYFNPLCCFHYRPPLFSDAISTLYYFSLSSSLYFFPPRIDAPFPIPSRAPLWYGSILPSFPFLPFPPQSCLSFHKFRFLSLTFNFLSLLSFPPPLLFPFYVLCSFFLLFSASFPLLKF